MNTRHRLCASALALTLIGSTAACTTIGSTTTFNTSELAADAAAIAYAAQAIEQIPSLSSHLSTDDAAKVNSLLAEIKSITATIAANSNGAVSVDTSKDWSKKLGQDLATLLQVVGPIVGSFVPGATGYLATVQQLVPLVEALTGAVGAESAHAVSAPMVRARVYQGV